jgi:hypothetical protein
MNNVPVAYAMFKDDEFYDAIHPKQYTEYIGSYTVPLYTHPAKTLTDEEIEEIAKENTFEFNEIPPIQFARAILKKAS